MKKTKMGELYDLYLLRPEISNREAATILGVSNGTLRQMKSRLSLSGNIKVAANGSVSMIEPLAAPMHP